MQNPEPKMSSNLSLKQKATQIPNAHIQYGALLGAGGFGDQLVAGFRILRVINIMVIFGYRFFSKKILFFRKIFHLFDRRMFIF